MQIKLLLDQDVPSRIECLIFIQDIILLISTFILPEGYKWQIFMSLTYPSCGGKFEIANQLNQFACANCGTGFVVERYGGFVNLEQVVRSINQVKIGVDRATEELTRIRINQEISDLEYKKSILKKPNLEWTDILLVWSE
jgi:hypothetical protein